MSDSPYAGFWIRGAALLLDGIIIFVPAFLLQLGLITIGLTSASYLVGFATLVLAIYMEGMHGATPGKMILGLRVVNEQGAFIGIPTAILRYLGRILCWMTLGGGYAAAAFNDKKQGLHDKIAHTYVLKRGATLPVATPVATTA
jgi:uncharacterized RDD family membrane protein YckC